MRLAQPGGRRARDRSAITFAVCCTRASSERREPAGMTSAGIEGLSMVELAELLTRLSA